MTRPWFPPVHILEVGRAVELAAKNAPKPRRRKPSKSEQLFERSSKATVTERQRFLELTGDLLFGRFAIKLINGRWSIFDADSHEVFGSYRTYDDALLAARALY